MPSITPGFVRKMVSDDLDRVLSWRNSEPVRQFMYTTHEIGIQEHWDWFERKTIDPAWALLIFEDAGGPCGYVSLRATGAEGIAEWGFYTAPSAPKGTGSRLGISALNHAFEVLRFTKICGQALAANENSIRFHKKMGFRQEDVLIDQQSGGGDRHQILSFGLNADEWPKAKARLMK